MGKVISNNTKYPTQTVGYFFKKNLNKVSLRSVLEYCYAIKSNNKKHTRFRLVGSVVRAKAKDYLQEKEKGANFEIFIFKNSSHSIYNRCIIILVILFNLTE